MIGGLGALRDKKRRCAWRGTHGFSICAATSPISSSVFHTASALSAPSGHLPLEGKADDARIAFAQDDEMRRTTPLNLFRSIYRQHAP